MDRTHVTPDPDDLLEAALTDPESFDAARTTRLVVQLEHDDAEVQRAASWALRFVVSETPSLVDACAGRFRQTVQDPAARPIVFRTLAVLAEHNQEAVAEIIDGAVEAEMIDKFVGQQIVAGHQPPELNAGGSVIPDDGDETTSPAETASIDEGSGQAGVASNDDPPPTFGHPPSAPPASPPRLNRTLADYESETRTGEQTESTTESIQFAEGGREFTATYRRAQSAGNVDEDVFQTTVDRWCRIDDHDAVARVVDHGTRPVSWLIAEQGALGTLVERDTPVPPIQAQWVLSQLADAVHYAHVAGVLHGGIWPGAITFVDAVEDPNAWAFPRIGHWGLREAFRSGTELFDMPRRYAAPEHINPDRFGTVDAATDIYGLGIIGYELLTGSPPIREDGSVHPAQGIEDSIPDGLSTILTKSLTLGKMERYASAAAFKRDLAAEDNNV